MISKVRSNDEELQRRVWHDSLLRLAELVCMSSVGVRKEIKLHGFNGRGREL